MLLLFYSYVALFLKAAFEPWWHCGFREEEFSHKERVGLRKTGSQETKDLICCYVCRADGWQGRGCPYCTVEECFNGDCMCKYNKMIEELDQFFRSGAFNLHRRANKAAVARLPKRRAPLNIRFDDDGSGGQHTAAAIIRDQLDTSPDGGKASKARTLEVILAEQAAQSALQRLNADDRSYIDETDLGPLAEMGSTLLSGSMTISGEGRLVPSGDGHSKKKMTSYSAARNESPLLRSALNCVDCSFGNASMADPDSGDDSPYASPYASPRR